MENKENYFLAGFIAGEGCFYANIGKCFYEFTITCHERDIEVLEKIKAILGGSVKKYPSRPTMVRHQVGGIYHIREVIIPFMDEYLLYSHKKFQYLDWKQKVLDHKLKRKRKSNTYSC